MIDLHMHTNHSDGSLSVSELLRLAEQKKITVISVTDHNSVGAYKELENKTTRKLFNGKIIKGIELSALYNSNVIEILGYDIDVTKMSELIKGYPPCEFSEYMIAQTYIMLKRLGLETEQKTFNHFNDFLEYIIKQHKNYIENTDKELLNRHTLYRKGITNKESKFYVDMKGYYKNSDEIISLIHKSGGKAFLAHPAEYGGKAGEILEYLKNSIDGIECFHYSAELQYQKEFVEFAKKNNLLISGGSDFHGTSKPTIELGVGNGDLEILGELVDWVNHVNVL